MHQHQEHKETLQDQVLRLYVGGVWILSVAVLALTVSSPRDRKLSYRT